MAGRLLADGRHLPADTVEVGDRVSAIDSSTAERQVLEGESCTFRVGDIVRVLGVTHGGVLAAGARRGQLALDLLEELLQVGRQDGSRLYEGSLESIHTVSEVREVLGRRIVGS